MKEKFELIDKYSISKKDNTYYILCVYSLTNHYLKKIFVDEVAYQGFDELNVDITEYCELRYYSKDDSYKLTINY